MLKIETICGYMRRPAFRVTACVLQWATAHLTTNDTLTRQHLPGGLHRLSFHDGEMFHMGECEALHREASIGSIFILEIPLHCLWIKTIIKCLEYLTACNFTVP
jgi:hypothetical protein